MTCGAVVSRTTVAITVKKVKRMRQSLSNTIAANFQSHSVSEAFSSFLIFSVITRSSFKINESSLTAPLGRGVSASSAGDLQHVRQSFYN